MNEGYSVLGEYHPSIWDRRVIGIELGLRVQDCGLTSLRRSHPNFASQRALFSAALSDLELLFYISVRKPKCHEGDHKSVRGWHRDGHANGGPMSLVLWSSETPTEFLLPNGSIVQPKPFEIVLADNLKVKHRMPEVLGKNRWFFRQAVQTPVEINQ